MSSLDELKHRELTINYDVKQFQNAEKFPLVAAGLLALFFAVRYSAAPSLFSALFQILLFALIILLIVTSVSYLFLAPSMTEPVAIASEKGMYVRNFGLIPWKEIVEIAPYRYKQCPLESLGIRVNDRKTLSKQSSFQGSCQIFWSRIFGYPPILLSNIDTPYNVIIRYSEQFLKKS